MTLNSMSDLTDAQLELLERAFMAMLTGGSVTAMELGCDEQELAAIMELVEREAEIEIQSEEVKRH